MKAKIGLFLYALVLSGCIAMVAFAFLFTENGLWELLWQEIPRHLHDARYYRELLIIIGTCLLLIVKKYWGNVPHNAHSVMGELRQTHTVDYTQSWRNMLASLVVLAFGAGVGPEATLVGIVISYSIWEADKLRWLTKNQAAFHGAPFKQKLIMLCCPYRYLLSGKEENHLQQVVKHKKLFDGLLIVNGVALFWLMVRLTDQPSFITRVGASHWQSHELWLMPLLMAYGWLFGKTYRWLTQRLSDWLTRIWQPGLSARVVLAAIVMAFVAWYFPQLLFSGQHSLHWAVNLGLRESTLMLLGLAALKLFFLDVCLWGSWTGGNIFPIVFAALLNGFAIAHLLPANDTTLIVMLVGISSGISLLGNIWLIGIFMLLFFPMNLWPIAILLMLIWLAGQRFMKRFGQNKSTK